MFFYGTLTDPDVLELVIGHALPAEAVEPAVAPGFRRVFIAGRDYPMLLRHPPGRVAGILVAGLDTVAIHRLLVFEGGEYALQPIQVLTGSGHAVTAHVFFCAPGVQPDRRPWRLEDWQRRHKRAFLRRTRSRLARMP